ncbi:endonuclease/exonuclease/phosphatase family protein [Streptomyces yaizuensis]|uniref:Endonuclease/exonuclease/phosphatase family protein n=1 Tax=Streptomyces yaizuensis TaxID=2989713 RepID=A0ABQ5NUV1_9ACTN|nr:endonuclease/exonuclease/phosphatase family protein [Streptomyces sp. YSPA8]GLF94144.1 endonuclease/exonuclease/phosphatase family protein [Streptomyces sp. YSPA8]
MVTQLPGSGTDSDGSEIVRVLGYNLRSLRDDEDALARVIRATAPDLVLAQEAPRFFRWRAHAARLAAKSGLLVLGGGAGASGPLALCSPRATVEHAEDVSLPRTPGLHRRGLATAVVRLGAARLGVAAFHLGLRADERYAHAGLLLDRLAALGTEHTVAAGDVNEGPGGRAFRRLAGALQDGWAHAPRGGEHTFPAAAPDRRIDAVFAGPGVTVLGCGVPVDVPGVGGADLRAATDHLPVLAVLRVPAAP